MLNSKHEIYLCMVFLILCSCANRVAPNGGPPDQTPALVVKTEPADRSTNVTDRTIVIEFDDYVDQSVRNAISVQPSVRFSSSYSGDEISVTFEDALLPNTTYAVTLGTDWKDLHGNAPPSATTIIFSTGPVLDSGMIKGQVSASNKQGLFVFAYANANSLDTSFTPALTECTYRIPVGTTGAFTVGGLRDGMYRVLVARDNNRNKVVDAGEDFAIDYADVEVKNGTARNCLLRIDDIVDTTKKTPVKKVDTSKVDTTATPVEPGSATGSFVDSTNFGPPYLVRFINSKSGIIDTAVTMTNGENWSVPSIVPGTYALDVVQDVNNNHAYDAGQIRPFHFGEHWKSLSTTLTIRERWSTDDVRIVVR